MEPSLPRSDDTESTATSTLCTTERDTPTHTTDKMDLDISPESPPKSFDFSTIPWPGETYIILHRASNKAISINENGDVRLKFVEDVGMNQCCHWACSETHDWLGFKHAGRFLGHDNRGGFRAEAKMHGSWESINPRPHPDGGYLLMTQHWFRGPIWSQFRYMGISREDSEKLVCTLDKDQAALWNFVKV